MTFVAGKNKISHYLKVMSLFVPRYAQLNIIVYICISLEQFNPLEFSPVLLQLG
ncbi:hypothetical protein WN55_06271 [Dufourea novaeangliae]|uniref:Uncharacterized protein n=1 Tax=Dufourea novaeangliae TaxID=178035 RepID=A0A154PPW1_DUFNO|nr:hypothetical protein WN55_06271 [Dufourea novaeangliae]